MLAGNWEAARFWDLCVHVKWGVTEVSGGFVGRCEGWVGSVAGSDSESRVAAYMQTSEGESVSYEVPTRFFCSEGNDI